MTTHTPTPWIARYNTIWGKSDLDAQRGRWVAESMPAAERERIIACVNFFHGRETPTERIPKSGFWEMVEFLGTVARHEGPFDRDPQQFAKNVIEDHAETARALLAKLGIEP